MKIKSTFLKLVIGLIILGILIYKIGIKSILDVMSKINIAYVIPILIMIFLAHFVSTWKLKIFLKLFNIKISFFRLYHLYFLSCCFSMFIPGRMGELLLIYFLKKRKVSLGTSSALVILDKLIGIIVTFILASIGIFIFFSITQSLQILLLFIIGLSVFIFIIFSNFGRKIIKRFILRKWEIKFTGFSKTLFSVLRNKKLIVYNFILSLIKWIASSFIVYISFMAFKQQVSIIMVLLITSILAIISLIPISINGLGIRESTGVFLFSLIGIKTPISTSVFLILLVINYLTTLIYLLLFFDQRNYKLNIRRLLNKNSQD